MVQRWSANVEWCIQMPDTMASKMFSPSAHKWFIAISQTTNFASYPLTSDLSQEGHLSKIWMNDRDMVVNPLFT